VPEALHFTADQSANELLARDPFALLIGFALDQQVTVQKAFSGPAVIRERVGSLEPARLAAVDLDAVFREKPAIHRFPGAMAKRVADLAGYVTDEYDGDASRIWTDATDADDLRARLSGLPGFGEMKVTSLASVLAKRFGVQVAEGLVPDHPTLGDVDSAEALAEYQAGKRAHKAKLREAAANRS
jgi:uncharacterized HhH-GPD family protein